MASGKLPPTTQSKNVDVPFERVVSMVRHLTHDARNGLNSVDLQAAYVAELVTEQDAAAEVKQLRAMITSAAKLLQTLSAKFWVSTPQFIRLPAPVFLEDFRDRLNRVLPDQAGEIVWTENVSEQSIQVDIEMIFSALSEFFKNAFDFREDDAEISVHAESKEDRFVIELREQKTTLPAPVEEWGRSPMVSTRRTGYGLGVFHAREILRLHNAELLFVHDAAAKVLKTQISFPVSEI